MPVSPPPPRNKKPTEADIEKAILRGGSPASVESVDPQTLRHVSARVTEEILRRIDALRARRPKKMGSPKMGVSVRDWIVEAVMEKLEREEKKYK